eukprot:2547960-Rhodomonas_salina.10
MRAEHLREADRAREELGGRTVGSTSMAWPPTHMLCDVRYSRSPLNRHTIPSTNCGAIISATWRAVLR